MITPRTAPLPQAQAMVPPYISTMVLTGAGFSVDAGLPVTNGLMARGRQRLHPERRAEFEDILDACTVNLLGKPVWKDDEIEAVLTRLTVLKMDHSDFAASPGDPPKEHDYLQHIFPVEHGLYFLIWLALLPSSSPPSLDQYDAFLAHLGHDVAFATLNYDLLLETIFRRNQRFWHYPLQGATKCHNELRYGDRFYASLEDDPHSIPYLKLHGSFNWHYCWRCDYIRVVRDEWFGISEFHLSAPGHMPLWVTSRGPLACDEDNCVVDSSPGVGQPALNPHIIPPTRIKDYSRTPISWQWACFDALVRQAEQLIIIGTSLRSEDVPLFITLQYLGRKNPHLTKLTVINPDPEAASKAEMWTEVQPTWYPSLGAYLPNE
jgi:hypothetical protein